MMPMPPSCFEAMTCPFCHFQNGAFVRSADNSISYFCSDCGGDVTWSVAEFCEKVSEVIQAEKETHKFWKRITEAITQSEIDAMPVAGLEVELWLKDLAYVSGADGSRWILGWYNGVRYKIRAWFS